MARTPAAVTAVLTAASGLVVAALPASPAAAAQHAFASTGGEQTWTVPAGVTKIHVVAVGAKGGDGGTGTPAPAGGFGGVATADVKVTPGQTLYIEVGGAGGVGGGSGSGAAPGGAGGFNGGGDGGPKPSNDGLGQAGGGGGGASDVRTVARADGASLASRLVIAAGGGGGGGGDDVTGVDQTAVFGGDGGDAGSAGSEGTGIANYGMQGGGGGAGTSSAGGAPGGKGDCVNSPTGADGTAGAAGQGGTGGNTFPGGGDFFCDLGGGGGGGGLYGGGGGGVGTFGGISENGRGGGGGGGGSSGFGAGTSTTSVKVDTTGTPSVTISWTPPTYKPDGMVKRAVSSDSYVGNNIYNTTGTNQTRNWTAKRTQDRSFLFRFQNDGNVNDSYRIDGCGSSTGFAVSYFKGTTKVTSAVAGGTYKTGSIKPGAAAVLKLKIHVTTTAKIGAIKSCLVSATSRTKTTKVDAPRARLTVVKS